MVMTIYDLIQLNIPLQIVAKMSQTRTDLIPDLVLFLLRRLLIMSLCLSPRPTHQLNKYVSLQRKNHRILLWHSGEVQEMNPFGTIFLLDDDDDDNVG
jgi:hypothetical protein